MTPEPLGPQHVHHWLILAGTRVTWVTYAKELSSDDDNVGLKVEFLRSETNEWKPSTFTFDYGWQVLAQAKSKRELYLLYPEFFI